LLRTDTSQFIQLLVQQQSLYYSKDVSDEEHIWQRLLFEDISLLSRYWNQLNYPTTCQFGHIYLYINEQIIEGQSDPYPALKEIVESSVEEETYLLSLSQREFVWIIPHLEQVLYQLDDLLKGLIDTITSECMINIKCFKGEPYFMPCNIKEIVKREQKYFHLAIQYASDRKIIQFNDIIPLQILSQCKPQDLELFVHKLLGPVIDEKELLHSVAMFLRENLNLSETAKKLFIHRNSMQYRLDKFIEKTGLDIRQFDEAVKVYLALQILGMIHKE
jgi:sugar diacid utilization regulator